MSGFAKLTVKALRALAEEYEVHLFVLGCWRMVPHPPRQG